MATNTVVVTQNKIQTVEVIRQGAQGIPGISDHPEQVGFFAYSDSTFTVSEDPDNPSFIPGYIFSGDGNFSVDAQGGFKNLSGRTLNMSGSFSYTPKISGGGGTRTLHIFSENSIDDGVTWNLNPGSHRPIEISNATESFKTTVAFLQDWPPGLIGRFRMFTTGGALVIAPTSTVGMGSQTIAGRSVIFEIAETFRNV